VNPHKSGELAFLIDSGRFYFAFHDSSQGVAPTSSVIRLIQGIYDKEPEQALRLVRNRIFTTAQATEMCLGMVRVAAKRLTDQISMDEALEKKAEFAHAQVDLTECENALAHPLSYETQNPLEEILKASAPSPYPRDDEAWMSVALKLSAAENSPVSALLLSAENELLAWGLNTNARNRTFHAEINLVQSFYRKFKTKIPEGAKIITTLKPCKMCAAMIWSFSEKIETLKVLFAEDDPGSNARETVLNSGTFERKRASKTASELSCEIELQLGSV
jgi:tRNA(Arg) A34 adenosine deaminase TadA